MKLAGNKNPSRSNALFAAAVLLMLGVSIALRTTELKTKSLWLDEFHTIDIAEAPNLSAVIEKLRPDFHAPAYFFVIHLLGPDSGEAGRWVSIIFGILTILMALLIAIEVGFSRPAQFMTVAAFACLPFQIQFSTEMRPYSLLGFCALATIWTAISHRFQPRIRFLLFVFSATLGLYTHYLMCLVILGIGGARLLVRPQRSLSLRQLILAGFVAMVCFLPWIVSVESWVFSDPSVMVRNEKPVTQELAEQDQPDIEIANYLALPVRLLSPLGGTLGQSIGWVVRWASAILAIVGAMTLAVKGACAFRSTDPNRRRFAALMLVGLINGILTLIVCSWLWHRLPIQYFMIAAWIWPFLLGGLLEIQWVASRLAPILTTLLALVAAVGITHVIGESREDFRRATNIAVTLSETDDALCTAVLSQPSHYNNLTAFHTYEPAANICTPAEAKALPARRCVVLSRSLRGNEAARLKVLGFHVGNGRRVLSQTKVGRNLEVFLLSPVEP